MLLRMTIANNFKMARSPIITFFLTILAWLYYDRDMAFLVIGLICHAFLVTIPSLLIHISYYRKNKGEEIEVRSDSIIIRKNGKERTYFSEDLERIVIVKPASLDSWGIPLSAMDYYHFVRIITKANEEIYITCLMSTKVDQIVRQIRGVPFHRKKGLALLNWRD